MGARTSAVTAAFACLVACDGAPASPTPARPPTAAPSSTLPDAAVRDASEPDALPAGPFGPSLPVTPVGHEGRWLTDALGRVVLPHGVNVVNKNPPYYPSAEGFSDADAAWIAESGFRVVRVGMLATGLMPTPGVVDSSYVQALVDTVHDLADHQIFSILDLHQDGWGPDVGSDGFPAWMTLTNGAMNVPSSFPVYYEQNPAIQAAFQSFWDDQKGPDGNGLEEDYATMFGAVAGAVANEPFVLGYDLFNEPWPGTTWQGCLDGDGGCPTEDQGELGPAYAKAARAIRAAGDTHLIFGEPFVLFNFGFSPTSIPVPGGDPNAGMSFHVYPLSTSYAPDVVAAALSWSSGTGGALINTEWGAVTDTPTLTSESLALDQAFIPWIFWSFCCELVPTFDAGPGAPNLVPTTASALIRPYPLAVAGEPTRLDLDLDAVTMTFSWSTSRVGGGDFADGTVTTFEMPAFSYPNGYRATVTGGWVTSPPAAPLLTVLAKPGVKTVTVAVKPAGGPG